MIREAKEQDLNQIEQAYEEHFKHEEEHGAYTVFKKGIYLTGKNVREALERRALYVYEQGGEIAGSMILDKRQPEEYGKINWCVEAADTEVMVVHLLLVQPDMKGLGAASALLRYAEEQARDSGCKVLRLDTGSRDISMISLYQKNGFCIVEEGTVKAGNEMVYGTPLFWEKRLCVPLLELLEQYQPCNAQEEKDRLLIMKCLREEPDVFTRENQLVHMTASGWVVNRSRDKVLMCYHRLYNSWSWLGGHADGEMDPLYTAIREVKEESGLKKVRPVSGDIFSVESLTVDGHMKKDSFVSSHIHLNITYLLEADENEPLVPQEDENKGVAWFGLEEAVAASTEPWFQERIYKKLNEKLRALEIAK